MTRNNNCQHASNPLKFFSAITWWRNIENKVYIRKLFFLYSALILIFHFLLPFILWLLWVMLSVIILYTAAFFTASFLYDFFSILNISDDDFLYKTQNLMFAHFSKDDPSKSDKWKICIVKNELQLISTVPEMNSRWVGVSLFSVTSFQKNIFSSNKCMCECRWPFWEFDCLVCYYVSIFKQSLQFSLS